MRKKIEKNMAIQLILLASKVINRMSHDELEVISKHVVRKIGRNPDEPLCILGQSLARQILNFPNRFSENGEKKLLDLLEGQNFKTLFDVGANKGVWSKYAAKIFPEAYIHAFEIVPDTFEKLRRVFPNNPRIKLNRFGLDERTGEAPVYVHDSDLISSFYEISAEEKSTPRLVQCQVMRGADYVTEQGVQDIDFLKIDVEGGEKRVIAGFEPLLRDKRIRLIQFEYNRNSIAADFLLKSAHELFGGYGYRLGRLMPDGVQFQDYHYSHEDFIGPNYVAVRSDDVALQAVIARSAETRRPSTP